MEFLEGPYTVSAHCARVGLGQKLSKYPRVGLGHRLGRTGWVMTRSIPIDNL